MQTSESINEIAAALAKAQGEMGGAVKDSANPFFKSKYADLASVREACIGPLSKHGIAVVQSPAVEGPTVAVVTLLAHSSGQWIRGSVQCIAKDDSPQAVGSAITYLRRYALQSFAGVAPEDDDAETAQGRGQTNGQAAQPAPKTVGAPPKGYLDWLDDLKAASDEGTTRLQKAWKESAADYRSYLTTTAPKVWESIKAHAAKVSEPVHA